jgi:DNA polymerase-3 subunit epsilon
MRQIFLDTETTGLSPEQGDRLIEIGCVEMVNRKLTGNNLHFYVNPGRDSHEQALAVHGITTEFLRDKPAFDLVADEFLAYVRDAEIIIHNAPFDVGFLNMELSLAGHPQFKAHVANIVDSLAVAKALFPGKRNGLDALCTRLDVDNSGRTLHGALLDAELLADVYINMTRGQDALLIESTAPEQKGVKFVATDLSALDLPTLMANAQEQAAHEDVIAQLDKATGGKSLWKVPAAAGLAI